MSRDDSTRNPRNLVRGRTLGARARGSLYEQVAADVDSIRALNTDLGRRPYTVVTVKLRWTGGVVGRGELVVVDEIPLTPTPRVGGIAAVEIASREAGGIERGLIRLTEISPRYTEDDIRTYFHTDLREDEEGFIEVRIDGRDGNTSRKRYTVVGVPERRPDRHDWFVRLRKQDQNRRRNGSF